MPTLEEHFQSINTKLQAFIKKHAAIQKENAILLKEIEKIKADQKNYLEKIETLEIQIGILKSSSEKMNDKERSGFEKKINQYIKDLDKCITMINN
jgi:chromosome segregation ATPase